MPRNDYQIDLRADYPERSSRGWAVLTILLIKLIALIPHAIILFFLGIAQFVVAIVAQVAVALNGEYPAGMHSFVAGVLRWQMRVTAFLLSLTDRYPPFTLQPDSGYPIDVAAERPAQSSRVYALFTLLVEVLAFAWGVFFLIELARGADWARSLVGLPNDGSTSVGRTPTNYNFNATGWSGLLLRQIAALPHLIVLAILGIALVVVWIIVQWVILFVARYPRGMYDFSAGVLRWQVRVGGYTLGLIDRYPPFTFDPSIAGPQEEQRGPAGPPLPPVPRPRRWRRCLRGPARRRRAGRPRRRRRRRCRARRPQVPPAPEPPPPPPSTPGGPTPPAP